jgi:hypothetical protein
LNDPEGRAKRDHGWLAVATDGSEPQQKRHTPPAQCGA